MLKEAVRTEPCAWLVIFYCPVDVVLGPVSNCSLGRKKPSWWSQWLDWLFNVQASTPMALVVSWTLNGGSGGISSMALWCLTFFSFFFLPHLQHMGVPGPGLESELQLRLKPQPQPQQHWIQAASVTYIEACENAGRATHRLRPGLESEFSPRQHQVLNPLSYNGNSWFLTFLIMAEVMASWHSQSYSLFFQASLPDIQPRIFSSSLSRDFFFLFLFRAIPLAHGISQARGRIGAAATSLHHSHSNVGSETCLWSIWAHCNAGSLAHWARPGIELAPSWILVGFFTCQATTGTPQGIF